MTGSHNEPEAQGRSGGEHLHTHIFNFSAWLHKHQLQNVCRNTEAHATPRSYSQVICCGSSYDGVQRPLGEALARSVVDKSYHDDCAVYPGRGQLHQLTGRGGQMKVQSEIHALSRLGSFFFFLVLLSVRDGLISWAEGCATFDGQFQPKGVPLLLGGFAVQNNQLCNCEDFVCVCGSCFFRAVLRPDRKKKKKKKKMPRQWCSTALNDAWRRGRTADALTVLLTSV